MTKLPPQPKTAASRSALVAASFRPATNLAPTVIQGGERLIRLPEMIQLLCISRPTIYRYVAKGRLPKPIQLSQRCVAWKASAINEWLATLDAAA